jgi:ribA/ribD-fused uncharacterized protein
MISKQISQILIFLNFLGIITAAGCMERRWQGRAIPMAFDKNTNQWNILLAHNKGTNYWSDFAQEAASGQKANDVAQKALAEQTNNVYTVSFVGVPFKKSDAGDFFHFVPVHFKPGSELYNQAKNRIKDDFIWVPASDIINQNPITHRGQEISISGGLYNFLRHNLPDIVAQLNKTRQTSAPLTSKTGGTWGPNYANHLYFYQKGAPYYEFTNYYALPKPVEIDSKKWATTEHYFQAQKYPHTPWLQDKIRAAQTPREAFDIGRDNQYAQYKDRNWDVNKYDVMKKAVRAKFTQDDNLKKLLIGTGDKILVEDAGANDADWGAGADYNGGNNLGKTLMAIRDELTGKKTTGQPSTPAAQPPAVTAYPEWTSNQQTIIDFLQALQGNLTGKSKNAITMLLNWLLQQDGSKKSTWQRVKDQLETDIPASERDLLDAIKQMVNQELKTP